MKFLCLTFLAMATVALADPGTWGNGMTYCPNGFTESTLGAWNGEGDDPCMQQMSRGNCSGASFERGDAIHFCWWDFTACNGDNANSDCAMCARAGGCMQAPDTVECGMEYPSCGFASDDHEAISLYLNMAVIPNFPDGVNITWGEGPGRCKEVEDFKATNSVDETLADRTCGSSVYARPDGSCTTPAGTYQTDGHELRACYFKRWGGSVQSGSWPKHAGWKPHAFCAFSDCGECVDLDPADAALTCGCAANGTSGGECL
jgi:hypothetical protein